MPLRVRDSTIFYKQMILAPILVRFGGYRNFELQFQGSEFHLNAHFEALGIYLCALDLQSEETIAV